MKRLLLLVLLFLPPAGFAGGQKVIDLRISGMTCKFCAYGVQSNLSKVPDTLFLPSMLDAVAAVESTSPVSGEIVRLTVSKDGVSNLTPDEAVVSLPVFRADEVDMSSAEKIRHAFCHRIYFFTKKNEAGRCCEGRGEMEVVRVGAAWRHAVETWGTVLSHAGARSASAMAEARA